jgi:hypothetical protein
MVFSVKNQTTHVAPAATSRVEAAVKLGKSPAAVLIRYIFNS